MRRHHLLEGPRAVVHDHGCVQDGRDGLLGPRREAVKQQEGGVGRVLVVAGGDPLVVAPSYFEHLRHTRDGDGQILPVLGMDHRPAELL